MAFPRFGQGAGTGGKSGGIFARAAGIAASGARTIRGIAAARAANGASTNQNFKTAGFGTPAGVKAYAASGRKTAAAGGGKG